MGEAQGAQGEEEGRKRGATVREGEEEGSSMSERAGTKRDVPWVWWWGFCAEPPRAQTENSFLAVNLVQRMKDSYAHRRPHRGPDRERGGRGDA